MVLELNESNFESEVFKSAVPVLVEFWASWCGPCRSMGPIVEAFAAETDSKQLKVGKCNVDENSALAQQYDVMTIPTFIIFKEGQAAERFSGSLQKEELKSKLSVYMK